MPRGSGFLHPNTPETIEYSSGAPLSLAHLRQVVNREETVVLPPTVAVWRAAFRHFVQQSSLSPFVRDAEAVADGAGPVLPPVARRAPLRKRSHDDCDDFRAAEPSAAGIAVVSHHKLTGERRFVYPDHDGVLSAGVVPRVEASAEERAAMEADRRFFVSPLDMTEEERAALEELEALWKSRARSHSVQGAQHRAAAGTARLGGEGGQENTGEGEARGHRGRRHHETHSAGVGETGDDALEDALLLAGELLDV